MYPASYNFTNVVAVIAVNESRVLPSYSNFGAGSTDIAAPGSDILSTELSGGTGLAFACLERYPVLHLPDWYPT